MANEHHRMDVPVSRRTALQALGMSSLAIAVTGGLGSLLAACSADSGSPKSSGAGSTGGAGGGGTAPGTVTTGDAAGGSSGAPATAALTNLSVSFSSDLPSLDIATAFVGNVSTMCLLVHEQLVTYDNDLKLVGALATKWEQPKDTEWLFTLRKGVTFWNGSPLTADDVVYSLQRNLDPAFGSQEAAYLSGVESIAASGDDGVLITLKTPDETFPYVLTLFGIVNKAVAQPLGNKYAQPGGAIMGTGPYQVTSFVAKQGIELKRYEKYWGPRPIPDTLSAKIIPEETSRQLAMRSGDAIMCYDVSASLVQQWTQIPDVEVPAGLGLETTNLSFDVTAKPWSDIHVRRAVAHCWDPQFVRAVLAKGSSPATALVPTGMWASLLDTAAIDQLYSTLPSYGFDIDAAKSELAQSSVPGGFSAELKVSSASPSHLKAGLSLSENLAKIGVKLTVTQQDDTAWRAYLNAHQNLGIQIRGTGPDYPDPSDYFALYTSSQAVANGTNLTNYRNHEFDRIFAQQLGEVDKAKRAADLEKLLTMSVEDLPYLPLWWSGFAIAFRKDKMTYHDLTSMCYLQSWTANVSGP